MSESKPVCNRDAAVPYEQADTAICPHCGHTAREHWIARSQENVAQWERQSALASARDEVVRAVDEWRKSEESDAPGFVVGQKLSVIRSRAKMRNASPADVGSPPMIATAHL